MEAPRSILGKQHRRSKWLWWAITAVVAAILLIIIVVLAVVIIPVQHHPQGLPATVLVPLYAYPVDDAWKPLFKAINATSAQKFIVIINPESGPGPLSGPNQDFHDGIKQLNSHKNVQTVGYVRTGYGARPYREVLKDIAIYAEWSSIDPAIAMKGIFFDEVAHEYEPGLADELYKINDAAKNVSGIHGDKTIIHNPGVSPDPRLNVNNTDITVTFEQSLSEYRKLESSLESSALNRSEVAYIVHSATNVKLAQLVADLSHKAAYLFVTSRTQNYYENLGGGFQHFVDVMPS